MFVSRQNGKGIRTSAPLFRLLNSLLKLCKCYSIFNSATEPCLDQTMDILNCIAYKIIVGSSKYDIGHTTPSKVQL